MLECDVIIIGGGPAGASLAYYLAGKGLDIILVEKKKYIDHPVRCAEFVPSNVVNLFDFKINGINNCIEILETYIAASFSEKFRLFKQTAAPGFVLDRDILVSNIISRFKKLGGTFFNNTRAISIKQQYGFLISTLFDNNSENYLTVKSIILAGADGPISFTGRIIGSLNKSFTVAIQQSPDLRIEHKSFTKAFFSPYIHCGYGWLFPKTDKVNLGIGTDSAHEVKNIFTVFKKHLHLSGIITENPESSQNLLLKEKVPTVTGLIPDSGIVDTPVSEGFILVGDAAGLCNPITGAGIYNSVYSARLVSEIIFKSLKLKDLKILLEIRQVYEKEFGNAFNRAISKKIYMKNNWNNKAVQFPGLIRKIWVAFKDFY